jgi:hypothetical protein
VLAFNAYKAYKIKHKNDQQPNPNPKELVLITPIKPKKVKEKKKINTNPYVSLEPQKRKNKKGPGPFSRETQEEYDENAAQLAQEIADDDDGDGLIHLDYDYEPDHVIEARQLALRKLEILEEIEGLSHKAKSQVYKFLNVKRKTHKNAFLAKEALITFDSDEIEELIISLEYDKHMYLDDGVYEYVNEGERLVTMIP